MDIVANNRKRFIGHQHGREEDWNAMVGVEEVNYWLLINWDSREEMRTSPCRWLKISEFKKLQRAGKQRT